MNSRPSPLTLLTLLTIVLCMLFTSVYAQDAAEADSAEITADIVAQAEKLIGIEFTPAERDSMLDDLNDNLAGYRAIRKIKIDNSVAPALFFNPMPTGQVSSTSGGVQWSEINEIKVPDNFEDLAFFSVRQLAELIKNKQVTSVQLTKLALDRLKKHDPTLHCVITLTEELALKQAAQADAEIASGRYRGSLHGIPYGAKDLLAAVGYPTTWGAMPFKDQMLDYDATVIEKLREAGAVLVAKLTLGALAWGDVWFADTTRNPWNPEQGSSGSSAGPASAVSAGLVPFAIGTETWGSIVSPSTRCGTTGLRPTFGRVSRAGAMALSWSMDKIGPICRTVEDCAIVFNAISGPDGIDQTVQRSRFRYGGEADLKHFKIGYLKDDFEADTSNAWHNDAVLQTMRDLGAELIEIKLPDISLDGMSIILVAEAAAAFDGLTRSGEDDLMVRQIKNAWPNVFRGSRLIPAVEYIQANRVRALLIQQMNEVLTGIDVYMAPTFEGDNLLLTNLTGHPCVVLPDGFDEDNTPTSITFIGRLHDDGRLLGVAKAYQDATDHHLKHPEQFK